MDIAQVYLKFPEKADCIKQLVAIRWKAGVFCPYCRSNRVTSTVKAGRFHCNHCNTSFSVTVKTPFHNTKLDFQKWFLAIVLIYGATKPPSVRRLGKDLHVTKDTALFMALRIRQGMEEQGDFFKGVFNVTIHGFGGG